MANKGKVGLRVLGVMMIIVGALSTAYNVQILSADPASLLPTDDHPHVLSAFRLMGGISMACHLFLVYLGAEFLRFNRRRLPIFVSLMVIEIGYILLASMACLLPGIGPGIAAAFSLANGGLMIQFLILLPLWGPLFAWWAFRQLD